MKYTLKLEKQSAIAALTSEGPQMVPTYRLIHSLLFIPQLEITFPKEKGTTARLLTFYIMG
jgi:hypothetical protein